MAKEREKENNFWKLVFDNSTTTTERIRKEKSCIFNLYCDWCIFLILTNVKFNRNYYESGGYGRGKRNDKGRNTEFKRIYLDDRYEKGCGGQNRKLMITQTHTHDTLHKYVFLTNLKFDIILILCRLVEVDVVGESVRVKGLILKHRTSRRRPSFKMDQEHIFIVSI